MAARPTTRRSSPRRCGCAPSARGCSALPTSPITGSTTPWRRRRPRCASCSTRCGRRRAQRALADRDAMQALVQEDGGNFKLAAWDWRYYAEKLRQRLCDFDESRDQAVSQSRPHDRGRLLYGAAAVRPDLHAAHRRAGLASRRAGLGGARPRRQRGRPVLRRLFRAAVQAQRRLDDLAARSGKARRRHPAADRQCLQFRQSAGRRADAAEFRRRAHAVPRIRPRAARPAVRRHLSEDFRHQRRHRFRRAAVAALRALAGTAGRAAALRAATTRPASRCRRNCCSG